MYIRVLQKIFFFSILGAHGFLCSFCDTNSLKKISGEYNNI
jgi:hypothetical protein